MAKTLENIEMAVKVHALLNALGKMISRAAMNEDDWETGVRAKDSGKIGGRGIFSGDPSANERIIGGD